jgi:hypothetical protein
MASSNSREIGWTILGGALCGIAIAASPLSVVFIAALVVSCWWATRDLEGGERRWIVAILFLAVSLRLLAILSLYLTTDHHRVVSFFWDGDGVYLKRRALWIRNIWLGLPVAPADFSNAFYREYGWTSYIYVIAYLQFLAGQAPYAIHVFNVFLSVLGSLLLYRLVRPAYGAAAASLGLALILFLPTPFFWSVSALKESTYLFFEIAGLVAVITVVRSKALARKAAAALMFCLALFVINTIRVGGMIIETVGIATGVGSGILVRRPRLLLLVLVIAPFLIWRAVNDPAIQARAMAQARLSAVLHMGNVRTPGHAYKLLDQRFYSAAYSESPIDAMTPPESQRFVLRALASFVLVPLPGQVQSASEMAFLPQQMLWYALVPLTIVGFVAGLRRDVYLTCTLGGLALVGSAIIAINSGNIGTMVRFRDTVVPFVVWLSALGAVVVLRSSARTKE